MSCGMSPIPASRQPDLFGSFFLGGFECATGYNREDDRIDLICDRRHEQHADADYRR